MSLFKRLALWVLDQPISPHGSPDCVRILLLACASPLIPFMALFQALIEGDAREVAWDIYEEVRSW
jgi:hypothetical protein